MRARSLYAPRSEEQCHAAQCDTRSNPIGCSEIGSHSRARVRRTCHLSKQSVGNLRWACQSTWRENAWEISGRANLPEMRVAKHRYVMWREQFPGIADSHSTDKMSVWRRDIKDKEISRACALVGALSVTNNGVGNWRDFQNEQWSGKLAGFPNNSIFRLVAHARHIPRRG